MMKWEIVKKNKKCGQNLRYYVAVAQRFNRLKTLKSLLKF